MIRYDVQQLLGEGAYGQVFKCADKETGRVVAVKKFKDSDVLESVKKTINRELRVMQMLGKHPNIVQLIESFCAKDHVYIVMEYVPRTLLQELNNSNGGLPFYKIWNYTQQVFTAVELLHSQNIIHRDIKPENLLLSDADVLKLCDFGFARQITNSDSSLTDYVSTRWYRAPELILGCTSYGKPVDIWSIGCLVAELANGFPLFPGKSDIEQLQMVQELRGPLCKLHLGELSSKPHFAKVQSPVVPKSSTFLRDTFISKLGSAGVALVEKMLTMDPDSRPSSKQCLLDSFFAECRFIGGKPSLFPLQIGSDVSNDNTDGSSESDSISTYSGSSITSYTETLNLDDTTSSLSSISLSGKDAPVLRREVVPSPPQVSPQHSLPRPLWGTSKRGAAARLQMAHDKPKPLPSPEVPICEPLSSVPEEQHRTAQLQLTVQQLQPPAQQLQLQLPTPTQPQMMHQIPTSVSTKLLQPPPLTRKISCPQKFIPKPLPPPLTSNHMHHAQTMETVSYLRRSIVHTPAEQRVYPSPSYLQHSNRHIDDCDPFLLGEAPNIMRLHDQAPPPTIIMSKSRPRLSPPPSKYTGLLHSPHHLNAQFPPAILSPPHLTNNLHSSLHPPYLQPPTLSPLAASGDRLSHLSAVPPISQTSFCTCTNISSPSPNNITSTSPTRHPKVLPKLSLPSIQRPGGTNV
ncbi:protein kinase domain protein [Pelomyxa schiedti]|nr:protein kinase domain protein [Pelomyxa schiedti]